VIVADLGVATDLAPHPTILDRKIRRGTRNLRLEPAMTGSEAVRAVEVGIDLAELAFAGGADIIVPGELGIGNTTAAAAMTARLLGLTPVEAAGVLESTMPGSTGRRPSSPTRSPVRRHAPRWRCSPSSAASR
jgi:nicotinate-nucleotide--dimethylbenzimidazole phosphoribosyltransferase